MKKVISALAALVAMIGLSTEASAYDNANTFGKGDLAVNVGLHIGSLEDEAMLGIGASAEYGILENLIKDKGSVGVGLMFGYGSSEGTAYKFPIPNERGIEVKYNNSIVRIATRGVFHYQFIPQLDTYAGMTFGIADFVSAEAKIEGIRAEKWDYDKTEFCSGLFAGIRYMLTDNFGLNAEAGLEDFSYLSIGVAFKF